MKLVLKIILLSFFPLAVIAQYSEKDSLLSIIRQYKGDTIEVNTLVYLARLEKDVDSVFRYVQRARELSTRLEYDKGKAHCLIVESDQNAARGNFAEAIEDALGALATYKK